MLDFDALEKKLRENGGAEKLMQAAQSPEGQRIQKMLDPERVQSAARSGDTQAVKSLLAQILSTDEGKRLAEQVKRAMEQK